MILFLKFDSSINKRKESPRNTNVLHNNFTRNNKTIVIDPNKILNQSSNTSSSSTFYY